jgi:hypothetical protein
LKKRRKDSAMTSTTKILSALLIGAASTFALPAVAQDLTGQVGGTVNSTVGAPGGFIGGIDAIGRAGAGIDVDSSTTSRSLRRATRNADHLKDEAEAGVETKAEAAERAAAEGRAEAEAKASDAVDTAGRTARSARSTAHGAAREAEDASVSGSGSPSRVGRVNVDDDGVSASNAASGDAALSAETPRGSADVKGSSSSSVSAAVTGE